MARVVQAEVNTLSFEEGSLLLLFEQLVREKKPITEAVRKKNTTFLTILILKVNVLNTRIVDWIEPITVGYAIPVLKVYKKSAKPAFLPANKSITIFWKLQWGASLGA